MRLMGLCNKQRNFSKKKGKEEALPWCRAASWEIYRRLISEQIELPCPEPFLISSQLLVAHTQKIRQKKQSIKLDTERCSRQCRDFNSQDV